MNLESFLLGYLSIYMNYFYSNKIGVSIFSRRNEQYQHVGNVSKKLSNLFLEILFPSNKFTKLLHLHVFIHRWLSCLQDNSNNNFTRTSFICSRIINFHESVEEIFQEGINVFVILIHPFYEKAKREIGRLFCCRRWKY